MTHRPRVTRVRGTNKLKEFEDARGPRHVVHGTIRPGEFEATYADSAEDAERIYELFAESRLRQIQIVEPDSCADLVQQAYKLAKERRDADEAARQASDRLKAVALRLLAHGTSELQTSQVCDVNRRTLRAWQGKH